MKRIIKTILIGIVCILVFGIGGFGLYVSQYSHADDIVSKSLESDNSVEVVKEGDNLLFIPEHAKKGIVFYPGGKVEYTSYAPLMKRLSEEGILCALLHVNDNLAFLETKASEPVINNHTEIKEWYMAGHSLGGVAGSMYVRKHLSNFKGMIFLASYTTKNFSKSNLRVLSIYGSNDGVLKLKSYTKAKSNLPSDFKEIIINGGCHAYFGNYGEQKGDGTPTINREQQQDLTVKGIVNFIK